MVPFSPPRFWGSNERNFFDMCRCVEVEVVVVPVQRLFDTLLFHVIAHMRPDRVGMEPGEGERGKKRDGHHRAKYGSSKTVIK